MDEGRKIKLKDYLSRSPFRIQINLYDQLETYNKALMHPSCFQDRGENGLQFRRLAFLGNYMLDFIVASYIYNKFPNDSIETLNLKLKVTQNSNLANIAVRRELGIDDVLHIGDGQNLTDSMIADAFEALIGAIYCDQGLERVQEIVREIFRDEIVQFNLERDAKGRLQMVVQDYNLGTADYKYARSGLEHDPEWKAVVLINGKRLREGKGKNKLAAALEAAQMALDKIRNDSFLQVE